MDNKSTKEEQFYNCIIENNIELVEKYISEGIDVNYYNSEAGFNDYLREAINNECDIDIVKALINAGANPNKRIFYTPLSDAIGKNLEIAELLLNNNGDPNTTVLGVPILCYECAAGSIESVSLLLEHGADPNLKGLMDAGPVSPMSQAIEYGQLDFVKLFVEYVVKLNMVLVYNAACVAAEKCGFELLEYLITECKFKVMPKKTKDRKPASLLHFAVYNNCKGLVTFLIENGADIEYIPNTHSRNCNTKVGIDRHSVLAWANDKGYSEIVGILLNAGADTSTLFRDDIFDAILDGSIGIIEEYILSGGSMYIRDRDWGYTLLDEAVGSGNIAITKLLLENGFDLKIQDKYGQTVLESFTEITEKYPEVEQRNKDEIIELLLSYGAE